MSKTRITVVSSDTQHLSEITRILEGDRSVGEVAALQCGAAELEAIADVPDVLIVNGGLPENGGLESLARLRQRNPDAAFIVVSDNQTPEFLLRAMRAGVREVLPTPTAGALLHDAIGRIAPKRRAESSAGKILAFTSCKGGSGATFIATNLAWVLAASHGKRVAFIDLNLQFGDASMYVTDQHPASDLAVVCQQIHRLDAAFLESAMMEIAPGFNLLAAPEDPAHATDVRAEHIESILKVARANYDFVIVDVGRSLDGVSLQPLDMADMIFPVVQLTLPFIREAKRLVQVLLSLGYPMTKVGLIVNRLQKTGEISIEDLERTVNAKVYKAIPNAYEAVAASVNQGEPIARLAKNSPVTKALREIADSLAATPEKSGKGWLSRLFATN
ncbi:AAA family ATPase [Aromatoleum petrolei]|uniref:AAA family ATPase n=1 Tax=Aromatoleum petrolei TaxID=76116 RepID=A0ABX1MQH2_9RHOO|nr:AAA family ATPase [Aromatoleum petrolei]NMF89436.1 AAA family ATPase [Aromatoleum petrolei]QTQ36197.1 Response regulator receiver domain protein [Aromatoleum petrolei]